MTRRKTSDTASIIDGVCGDNNIGLLSLRIFSILTTTLVVSSSIVTFHFPPFLIYLSLLCTLEGLYGTLRPGKKTLITLVLIICVMLLLTTCGIVYIHQGRRQGLGARNNFTGSYTH